MTPKRFEDAYLYHGRNEVAALLEHVGCLADATRQLMPDPPEVEAFYVEEAPEIVFIVRTQIFKPIFGTERVWGRVLWKGQLPGLSDDLTRALAGIVNSEPISPKLWHEIEAGDCLNWVGDHGMKRLEKVKP